MSRSMLFYGEITMPTNQQYSSRVCNIRRTKRLLTHIEQMKNLIGEMAADYQNARPEYMEFFLSLDGTLELMTGVINRLRLEL